MHIYTYIARSTASYSYFTAVLLLYYCTAVWYYRYYYRGWTTTTSNKQHYTKQHRTTATSLTSTNSLNHSTSKPNGRLGKTDTGAHDPFAPSRSPRPRRAIGVGPHPHGLLQGQPVSSGMLDERAGDSAAPKLSGGLSLGPLSSRRIQVSVCGPPRKTDLRCTYKGSS